MTNTAISTDQYNYCWVFACWCPTQTYWMPRQFYGFFLRY